MSMDCALREVRRLAWIYGLLAEQNHGVILLYEQKWRHQGTDVRETTIERLRGKFEVYNEAASDMLELTEQFAKWEHGEGKEMDGFSTIVVSMDMFPVE